MNSGTQTVDVEIKTVRNAKALRGHLQRDRRLRKVRTQAVKWTTEGARKEARLLVFCDVGHASVAGDMLVSC